MLVVLFMASCAHTPRIKGPCPRPVLGTRADATLATTTRDLYGFTWVTAELPPTTDSAVAAFQLQVTGGTASRQLGHIDDEGACGRRPLPDDPCTVVPRRYWQAELRDHGVSWTLYGVELHDWRELDDTALRLAGALRAWRIEEPVNVLMEPSLCEVLL